MIARQSFRSGPRRIDVVAASITELGERVGAIVSSDDNLLSHGGGVSEAIWEAAGPELADFVTQAHPNLRLGQVFVSPAGELDADAVIHAVTIDFDENRRIGPGQLTGLFYQVLTTADEHLYGSVALPLIGGGAAGVDNAAVLKSLEDALDAWLASPVLLTRIVITVAPHAFEEVSQRIRGLMEHRRAFDDVFRRVQFNHRGQADLLRDMTELLVTSSVSAVELRRPALAVLQEMALQLLLRVLEKQERRDVGSPQHQQSEHSLSGSAALAEVLRIALERGVPITRESHALLTQGVQARNRLAHAGHRGWSTDDMMAVSLATREALALIPAPLDPPAHEPVTRNTSSRLDFDHVQACRAEPEQVASHPTRARQRERQAQSAATIAQPARIAEGGTGHVRSLQKFLQTELEPSALAELEASLEEQGYAGSADARLLEHCLRVDNPIEFVASEFSRSQLASAVSRTMGTPPPYAENASELAQRILEYLGFPLPRPLGGLAAALAIVEQESTRLRTGMATDIGASVTRVATQLECICHVLLRFLARAAYDQTPEALFRDWNKLGPNESLTNAGLGKLIVLVEKLDARLEQDDTPVARSFKGSVERRRLFPRGAGDLAKVRNSFVHFRERETSEPSNRRLETALQFLDAARSFIEYLRATDTRLFPLMVRVTRIEIDSWGRRRIHAADDEGREELIFTDTALEPGHVYFMQPLSNPVRVDPILVPAGDLVWPEAGRVR